MRALCVLGLTLIGATLGGRPAWADKSTATGTAMLFYLLASEGRCAEAELLFTADSLKRLQETLGGPEGFSEFCRDKGGNSPLESLAVRAERPGTDQVEVEIMRTYKQGMAFETDTLVREGSGWKIAVGRSVSTKPHN